MRRTEMRIASLILVVILLCCIPVSASAATENTLYSWMMPCKWRCPSYIRPYRDVECTDHGTLYIEAGDECVITRLFYMNWDSAVSTVAELRVPGINRLVYLEISEISEPFAHYLGSWYWENEPERYAKARFTTYYGPSTSSGSPGWVDRGDHVYVIESKNGWSHIFYPTSGSASNYRLAWIYDPTGSI